MNDWFDRHWRAVFMGCFVALIVVATYGFVRTNRSNRATCDGLNEVRSETVSFIDDALGRSRVALQATVKSPFSTELQKSTARHNLVQLEEIANEAHHRLAEQPCN